ncbi:MAG: hypothetical protein GYB66_11360 [Chloroflexi bacterium]|nr:hypothetical protein [Chloroflexota bacterium]
MHNHHEAVGGLRWLFVLPLVPILMVLAIGAAVSVDGDIPARISEASAVVTLEYENTADRLYPDEPQRLPPGTTINVPAGGQVQVSMLGDGSGVITIDGPAVWTYVEGSYRGTLVQRMTNRTRDHTVVIRQISGRAHYDFGNTEPGFDEIHFQLEVPNGTRRPLSPCWDLIVDGTGARLLTVECPNQE